MSNWSWNLFGSTNKEKYLPVLNALEQQRIKQIETLKTCFPRAEEITKDAEYRIILPFQNENILEIYVFLPPNFPNEIPVVRVSPNIRHAWVNDKMIVSGCDAINNFYMHSNLGKALKEVCKQFVQIPPLFCQEDLSMPTRSSKEVSNGELVHLEQEQELVLLESVNQRNCDGSFDISQKLDSYSLEELNELNDHPEKIWEFTSKLQPDRTVKEREDQILNNEKIARENIEERLPRLEAARQRLLDKYEELTFIRKDFDIWSLRQNELCEIHTAVKIKTALQIAAAHADQQAENIAEDFLHARIAAEDFISKYMEQRKLSHLRHWKEDNVPKLFAE